MCCFFKNYMKIILCFKTKSGRKSVLTLNFNAPKTEMNHFDAKELSAINQTSPGAECESTVGFDIVGTIRLRCD